MNGALKKVTAVDICLALICTDESKDTLTKYEELCNKIRDRIRSITKSSSNFGDLLFKKRLKLYNMIINSYQVFFIRKKNIIHKFS